MDLKFLDVDIDVGGVQYPNNFSEDVKIDRTNLDAEFVKQPELYAYYASMEALAKHRKQVLKHEVDVTYAQVDAKKRGEALAMQASNPKFKYTEKMCENEVKTDPAYRTKVLEYLEAEKLANLLAAFRESMNNRRESLISLGANDRTGSFSPRILEAQGDAYKTEQAAKAAEPETTKPQSKTKSRRRPAKTA